METELLELLEKLVSARREAWEEYREPTAKEVEALRIGDALIRLIQGF